MCGILCVQMLHAEVNIVYVVLNDITSGCQLSTLENQIRRVCVYALTVDYAFV